jgi:Tfp pilus assembly protein PilF
MKNLFVVGLSAILVWGCASTPKSQEPEPKTTAQLYIDMGTQALLRGDFPQSVSDLRKALQLSPKNAIAHNHLGLAYYGLGKRDLAKQEVERAIELDSAYSDAYINLASIAGETGDLAQAKALNRKALNNLEYRFRHRALTNLAQIALQENKTDDARALLHQSLASNPNYCLTHFLMGTLYARDNLPVKAAEFFKKSVISTCTSNVEGHYQLGMTYMKIKQYDKARSAFVNLVENFPQTTQAQKAGEQLKYIP